MGKTADGAEHIFVFLEHAAVHGAKRRGPGTADALSRIGKGQQGSGPRAHVSVSDIQKACIDLCQ